jgi:hypothetical protein
MEYPADPPRPEEIILVIYSEAATASMTTGAEG